MQKRVQFGNSEYATDCSMWEEKDKVATQTLIYYFNSAEIHLFQAVLLHVSTHAVKHKTWQLLRVAAGL